MTDRTRRRPPERARHPSRGQWRSPRLALGRGPGLLFAQNSSRVSVISSRSRVRITPCASNNASHAASSPASAPEWAATIAFPASERPTVRATTTTSSRGRALERTPERSRFAHRLEDQGDHPRPRDPDGVVEIRRRRGDELLARGDRHRPTEAPIACAASPRMRNLSS